MNEHVDSVEEPNAAEMATIDALLSRQEVWEEPPAELENQVAHAIASLTSVTSLASSRSSRRRRSTGWWLSAAAACIAIISVGVVVSEAGNGDEVSAETEVELSGTAAAPAAFAKAELSATPAGLRIVLDVEGLPPAPEGHFYEAWVSSDTIRVSAGTFHLRRGHKPIELWAGVADGDFSRLAITLEPLDGDTDSSGDVQLSGDYRLDDD
jgi:hypothetical protein